MQPTDNVLLITLLLKLHEKCKQIPLHFEESDASAFLNEGDQQSKRFAQRKKILKICNIANIDNRTDRLLYSARVTDRVLSIKLAISGASATDSNYYVKRQAGCPVLNSLNTWNLNHRTVEGSSVLTLPKNTKSLHAAFFMY